MQNLNETKNSALKLENALIRWEAIDAIKNSKKQFRKHSKKKIERLAKQLKYFKIFIPIVVDADNEIVAGFARFNAAKILGLKTLPVIQVSHLTPEELEDSSFTFNARRIRSLQNSRKSKYYVRV